MGQALVDRKANRRINLILALLIAAQLGGVLLLMCSTYAGGDPIFTFTLANSPYSFNFIDSKIDRFSDGDGWFDAGILLEQYTASSYNRFNYAGVYWHQRLDVHPLLYYFLVHTICSLFPGSYSILYALVINLVALLLIDILLIRISDLLFGRRQDACTVLITVTGIVSVVKTTCNARMYMLLALMCLWFLWICLRILCGGGGSQRDQNSKTERKSVSCRGNVYAQLFLCVLLGSQTHYYFYVYAALAAFISLVFLLLDRNMRSIVWSAGAMAAAGCVTLILFPWAIWHIVFNQMEKNTSLHMWTWNELWSWLSFVNRTAFNSRGWLCLLSAILALLLALFSGKMRKNRQNSFKVIRSWLLIAISCLGYSVLIYTLNGAVYYYATPVYLPAGLCVAGIMTSLGRESISVMSRRLSASNKISGKLPNVSMLISVCISIAVLGSVSNFISHFRSTLESYDNYLAMHAVSEEYEDADCIYVASVDDNLMEGLLFEFGNYDEIKKVYAENYDAALQSDTGMTELLAGRKTEDVIILYIPEEMELPEGSELLACWNGFNAVKWDA